MFKTPPPAAVPNSGRCVVCKDLYTQTDMVECTKCRSWTHYKCANVGDEVENDVNWKCVDCVEILQVATPNSQNPQNTTVDVVSRKDDANFVSGSKLTNSNCIDTSIPVQENASRIRRRPSVSSVHSCVKSRTGATMREQLRLMEEEQQVLRQQQVLLQRRQELLKNISDDEQDWEQSEVQIATSKFHEVRINSFVASQIGKTHTMSESHSEKDNVCDDEEKKDQMVRPRNEHQTLTSFKHISDQQLAARQTFGKDVPIFSGHPAEWPVFYSSFMQSTDACGFSDSENLIRLQRCLKGKAREMVESQLTMPGSVNDVLRTLQIFFGRPELIIDQQIQRLRKLPNPKIEKIDSIINFSVAVKNICATISQSGMDNYLRNPTLMHELQEKLPNTMKMSWGKSKSRSLDPDNLCTFSKWLFEKATNAFSVTSPTNWTSKEQEPIRKGVQRNEMQNIFQHQEAVLSESSIGNNTVEKNKFSCKICGGECQNVSKCKLFIDMNIKDRWNTVKCQKLCRQCLRKHNRKCWVPVPCNQPKCEAKHHPMLHDNQVAKVQSPVNVQAMSYQTCSQDVRFRIVPVILTNKDKSYSTYAFLDEGSTCSLIKESISDYLKLEGCLQPLCLKWTGSVSRREENSKRVCVSIAGNYKGSSSFKLTDVRTVTDLDLPEQSLNYKLLAANYPYLQNLPVVSYNNAIPGILIGLRNWRVAVPLRVKEGDDKQPIAIKCRLGWTISCTDEQQNKNLKGEEHHFHLCECDEEHNNTELHDLFKEFFSVDSLGIAAPQNSLQQQESARAENLLCSTTTFTGDRYKTGLLWRHENFKLPDSRPMAMHRLRCLERRLEKDPVLAESMKQQINEYERKGYIRKLSKEELQEPRERIWYLPLFPIRNPNKPNKIRLVWDAAATVNGVSLNTMLLKGLDLNSSLLGVLLRCREKQVCLAADIKEMFHQVQISEQDQHVLRFLWRGLNLKTEPDTYVTKVMTFGATCSPSSAQFVKNSNAEKFKERFPRAVESIVRNHYVDDLLDCVDNDEEAVQLAMEITKIHNKAGFQICNWMSNSTKVMETLNPNFSNGNVNLNMNSEGKTEKVLGMWWNLGADSFTYSLRFNKGNCEVLNGSKIPTKREILKVLMSIYDPLGLIGHFLVYLKILLQDIWRSQIDWDDAISDEHFESWLRWLRILPDVEKLIIPRCYLLDQPDWFNVEAELHVFTDASEQACAAVAYIRIKSKRYVRCSLVAAKTKVAPIKLRSVPRLELDATVMGSRLAVHIQEQLTVRFNNIYYWTDSKTVLSWINGDPRKYNKYIAFRVAEVQENCRVKSWRYIPSKLNVADDATKWGTSFKLDANSRWFHGPSFLYLDKKQWPESILLQSNPEPQPVELLYVHTSLNIGLDFKRFSKWRKLLNCIAYVLRFINNTKKTKVQRGILKHEELREAEILLIKIAQEDVFSDEIKSLRRISSGPLQPTVSKSSSIYRLSPYLDDDGVLRVQGRIDAAVYLMEETRRPAILPRNHEITRHIVTQEHERFLHSNNESVVNSIRTRFFIPQLRCLVKTITRECQFCKIEASKPLPPRMAPLPAARLSVYTPPFTYVGVDYFGPIMVKVGRRVEKRWGVLFTCLTIRAVHIEIAHKMDADTFILCFSDFISRRGYPSQIFCDRGTNFVGAERLLREELKNVSTESIAKHFTSPMIKWNFNPPASPHMGGSWERLVRSFKHALYRSLPTNTPSDQLLRSCLVAAENIINSRPLTYIPLDSETHEALTPNHFLGLNISANIKPLGNPDSSAKVLRFNYKYKERFADRCWKIFISEYLPDLTLRTKWYQQAPPIQVGDIVLIIDGNLPRNNYPKGRVIQVRSGADGQVRSATLQMANGIMERPAVKLARLEVNRMSSNDIQQKDVVLVGSVGKSQPQALDATIF